MIQVLMQVLASLSSASADGPFIAGGSYFVSTAQPEEEPLWGSLRAPEAEAEKAPAAAADARGPGLPAQGGRSRSSSCVLFFGLLPVLLFGHDCVLFGHVLDFASPAHAG